MIEFDIKPWCHECPCFVAKSDMALIYDSNISHPLKTVVYCNNRDKCSVISEYLERKYQNEMG